MGRMTKLGLMEQDHAIFGTPIAQILGEYGLYRMVHLPLGV